RRRANLLLALWRFGNTSPACEGLRIGDNPRVRYHLIHSMAPYRIDPASIAQALQTATDHRVRSALLLALGDYSPECFPPPARNDLQRHVMATYSEHPDPGVHSAAKWLLERWGAAIPSSDLTFDQATVRGCRWFTADPGQT